MNIVKLTRIQGAGLTWYIEDEEIQSEEYVNLDHARIIRPGSGIAGSSIDFSDPGLETTERRFYVESVDEMFVRLYAQGWRS